jgi:hypothetical protein
MRSANKFPIQIDNIKDFDDLIITIIMIIKSASSRENYYFFIRNKTKKETTIKDNSKRTSFNDESKIKFY